MTGAGTSPNVGWHTGYLDREERWAASGLRGATVWLTGLSGSGKSTVAAAVERLLVERGPAGLPARRRQPPPRAQRRPRLSRPRTATRTCAGCPRWPACSPTPAWSPSCPLISPYRAGRDRARGAHAAAGLPFLEVFVDTPHRAVRAAGPEGSLRQGPGGRDHRLHRRRRSLRGPRAARAGAATRRRRPRHHGGPRRRPAPRAGHHPARQPGLTARSGRAPGARPGGGATAGVNPCAPPPDAGRRADPCSFRARCGTSRRPGRTGRRRRWWRGCRRRARGGRDRRGRGAGRPTCCRGSRRRRAGRC